MSNSKPAPDERFIVLLRHGIAEDAAPDQKDEDSLPPYDVLDRILKAYIEDLKSPQDIADKYGFDLTKHLEVIVIGIVAVTTFPVLYKLFFGNKKSAAGK